MASRIYSPTGGMLPYTATEYYSMQYLSQQSDVIETEGHYFIHVKVIDNPDVKVVQINLKDHNIQNTISFLRSDRVTTADLIRYSAT